MEKCWEPRTLLENSGSAGIGAARGSHTPSPLMKTKRLRDREYLLISSFLISVVRTNATCETKKNPQISHHCLLLLMMGREEAVMTAVWLS
jgi:hypothetical protein